jgi:hypothetical protein
MLRRHRRFRLFDLLCHLTFLLNAVGFLQITIRGIVLAQLVQWIDLELLVLRN